MTVPSETPAPPLSGEEATAVATAVVHSLTGGAWMSPPREVTEAYPVNSARRVRLLRRPIVSVSSVAVDGAGVEGFVQQGPFLLLPETVRCGKQVQVTYVYGDVEVPPLAARAIEVLAYEMQIAANGPSDSVESRLPERITSVSRQGVSWTMIDPQDFLLDGRTGIYEVDLCIRSMSRGLRRRGRPRVFTADTYPPAEVIRT